MFLKSSHFLAEMLKNNLSVHPACSFLRRPVNSFVIYSRYREVVDHLP